MGSADGGTEAEPYDPPRSRVEAPVAGWLARLYPTVIFIDTIGCAVFLLAVVGCLLAIFPPERFVTVPSTFSIWFQAFVATLVLRGLCFLAADILVMFRNRLCYVLALGGYLLTGMLFVGALRFITFEPWVYASQLVSFVTWNLLWLAVVIDRLHGRRREEPDDLVDPAPGH